MASQLLGGLTGQGGIHQASHGHHGCVAVIDTRCLADHHFEGLRNGQLWETQVLPSLISKWPYDLILVFNYPPALPQITYTANWQPADGISICLLWANHLLAISQDHMYTSKKSKYFSFADDWL